MNVDDNSELQVRLNISSAVQKCRGKETPTNLCRQPHHRRGGMSMAQAGGNEQLREDGDMSFKAALKSGKSSTHLNKGKSGIQ